MSNKTKAELLQELDALQSENQELKSGADQALQERVKILEDENTALKESLEEQHKAIESLESAATVKTSNPVVSINGKNYEVVSGRVKFKSEWVQGKENIAKNKVLIAHLVKIESGALKLHK